MKHIDQLILLGACQDAVTWAKKYKTASTAWKACQRGDRMLWYAGKLSGPPEGEGRKRLVPAACECARLALPIYEKLHPDDKRVRVCNETAERWAVGGATLTELRTARAAAADADYDDYADYAAYAVAAAAYTAYIDCANA